jgi:chromosome segregation ATPase
MNSIPNETSSDSVDVENQSELRFNKAYEKMHMRTCYDFLKKVYDKQCMIASREYCKVKNKVSKLSEDITLDKSKLAKAKDKLAKKTAKIGKLESKISNSEKKLAKYEDALTEHQIIQEQLAEIAQDYIENR